jgi:hypothetical protein
VTTVELTPTAELSDRPFTHPRYVQLDLQVMRFMATCTWMALERDPGPATEPFTVHQPTAEAWSQRLLVTQPARLCDHRPLTVVGFFGLKGANADVALAQRLDRRLLADLSDHPDLLAYVSTCLPTGNFGNLVLFASPEGKHHWGTSALHADAIRQLTPEYYAAVRLYNGEMSDGLAALESLRLHLVKYYDYRSRPLWRAVRRLSPEISA